MDMKRGYSYGARYRIKEYGSHPPKELHAHKAVPLRIPSSFQGYRRCEEAWDTLSPFLLIWPP